MEFVNCELYEKYSIVIEQSKKSDNRF